MASREIGLTSLITWLLCLTTVPSRADDLPTCLPKDFHYEFTECDELGGRWRVSVPKPGSCIGGAPNPPERDNCTTSCEPGWYLDRSNLRCQACAAGSYSLGGGIQIDNWSEMPAGFHASQESFGSSFRFLQRSTVDTPVNCSEYAWKPQGTFIASQGGPCSSMLSYNVKIVKEGAITFTYQYTDDNVLFTFEAQNDRCQTVQQSEKFKWPPKTEEGGWRTLTVHLSMGLNILYWKTVGVGRGEYYGRTSSAVRIRSITISGVAYTSECSPCPLGTHSSEGSKKCTACPANTYAQRGSPDCKPCKVDTQYAPSGYDHCLERPPCTKMDYLKMFSTCDEKNQSTVTYQWRTPKVCRDDHEQSILLPAAEKIEGCMECNPGMEQTKSSNCTFCPPDSYSKGINKCQKCLASTAPNYGLYYKVWHDIPPYMNSRCISFEESDCGEGEAWIPQVDYIQSGAGHGNDTYLVLSLEVAGFRNKEKLVNGQTTEVGIISFSFELVCSTLCDFVFMESSSRNNLKILNNWKGGQQQQQRQQFSYSIRRNDSYVFTWAFQKLPYDVATSNANLKGMNLNQDSAIIYDVTVTNTITGGASECVPCPRGAEADGCISCPPGQYLDGDSCVRCPSNTYVTDRLPRGPKSCKPCGAGLRSNDGQSCYSDCTLMLDYQQEWADFSELPKFMEVKGGSQFTATGMHFYHVFNISLCGRPKPETTCKNNITDLTNQTTVVESMVCRSTVVPSRGDGDGHTVSTQSVSIGDWLIGVTRKPVYQNIHVIEEFLKGPERYSDIHFYYIASGRTPACPTGRNTTVTLRCDKLSKDPGEISTPKACPDGTCDGCSFHFLWKTRRACRICTENDYEVVKGECNNGVQIVHYISPKDCIPQQDEETKPRTKTRMCSAIPFELQILIAAFVALGVLLMALILYCWKKNRKLEYKYMKLVQSGSGKDGELPSAESCAIYDDDDDQYDAVVSDRKSHGLLSKFPGRQSSQVSGTHPLTEYTSGTPNSTATQTPLKRNASSGSHYQTII